MTDIKKNIGGQAIFVMNVPIEDVLPYVNEIYKKFGDHWTWMNRKNLRLFIKKGIFCISCGLEGKFFKLHTRKHAKHYEATLNLYGVAHNGEHVIITIDHICPASLGGCAHMHNLQPMCVYCNNDKRAVYVPGDGFACGIATTINDEERDIKEKLR